MGPSACWLFFFSMAVLEMSVKTEDQSVLTLGYSVTGQSEPSSFIYFDNKTFQSFQECLFKQSTILCVAHFTYSSSGIRNVTEITSQDKNVAHNLFNHFLCLHDVSGKTDEVQCTRTEKHHCDSNYKRHPSLNVLDQNYSCLLRSVYISWKGYPKFGIYSYDIKKLAVQQCNCTNETASSDIGLTCVPSTTVPCSPTTFTSEDVPLTTMSFTKSASASTEISSAEILNSTKDPIFDEEDDSKTHILIGGITGAIVLVVLITIIGVFIFRKRNYKAQTANNKIKNIIPPSHSSEEIRNLENRREQSEDTAQVVPTDDSEAYYSSLDFDNNRRAVNKISKANHGNEMSTACNNRPTADTHVPVDTHSVGEYGGKCYNGIYREALAVAGITMPGDSMGTEKVTQEETHYSIIDPVANGNRNEVNSKTVSEKDISIICVGTTITSFEDTYNEIKDDQEKDMPQNASLKTHQDTRHNCENTNICTKAVTGSGGNNTCANPDYFKIDFEKTCTKNAYSKLGEKTKDFKNVYDLL